MRSNGRAAVFRLGLFGLLALALLGGATAASSHEKHQKPARPDSDSAAVASKVPGAADAPATAPEEAKEPPFEMPPMSDAVTHHLHNKLIHLPIVLAPVALVLLLAERRRPGAGVAAPLLVWAAALSSAAAFLSGRAQAGAFDDGPKEWLVSVHQSWGLAAMISLLVWAALASWPAFRRRSWIVGAIAVAAVLGAAFYGGLVAHG